jgi:hypothetical protein
MGLIRKTMSITTLGAVDFRSDKERTAAYSKGVRRQARKQTSLLREQNAMIQQMQAPEPIPPSMPARWYPDPEGAPCLRYWDGKRWTRHTAPLPAE